MSTSSRPSLGRMTGGSSGEHHLHFKPVDTSKTVDALKAAEIACQLAIQQIPKEVEPSQELLRYPEGEGNAVPITDRDMEELQPGKFLGNNIVDFYIRYLERNLPPQHGERFYFFNSFFFRKLLQSRAPTRIDPCKVDYEQLRKWTEKVNLFEKDYVFIPILHSSHWSLVVICHLSSLTCTGDETMRFPCMVHVDSFEGQNESLEGFIRSYILQAWMDRFQPSIDKDQLLALFQMKYVQAKVPQQVNFHDCGLYVLNYIEAFLDKSTSSNFNFSSSEIGVHFTSSHFVAEVLAKRRHIQNVIVELTQIFQARTRKHATMKKLIQELSQASANLQGFLHHEGYSEACIKDVQLVGSTIFNGENCEIVHASNDEGSMDVQHQQSTLNLRWSNESLSGPQIGLEFVEYKNRSKSLSPKQQHIELEMRTTRPTNFKGPKFEAKCVSTHQDSINGQNQQSREISTLDYEQLNGPNVRHAKYQRIIESSSSKLDGIPCIDFSKVLKGKNKRGKNISSKEASKLLSWKEEQSSFGKGSRSALDWILISKEIEKKLGSQPSINQCQLQYDTFLKAYNTYKIHCNKIGKTFFAITEEEQLDLKLATTFCEELYITNGYFKACINDVQLASETTVNGEGCKINYASNHEDSMDGQHSQSTSMSRANNEPLIGLQIEPRFVENKNTSESLPSKQYFELEMHTPRPTNFKDPFSKAKHASPHKDSINVQHQQPSGISRLDYEQLDGPELGHVEHEIVSESFSKESEEIPCMGFSEVVNGKNKRGRNMTDKETSVLLLCKLEGGRFCKGSGGATHWNLISKEIDKKLGSRPSADQCRLRYDTLLKAYKTYKKHCNKNGKIFSAITNEERLNLKVATTLCKEWYTTIGKICDKANSRKHIKINLGV